MSPDPFDDPFEPSIDPFKGEYLREIEAEEALRKRDHDDEQRGKDEEDDRPEAE